MKVIAAVVADLTTGPLGTASRLADPLHGEPVLRRTLRRLMQCKQLTGVHLLVPTAQAEQARRLAEGLTVIVDTHDTADVPWRSLVSTGRKWSLDAWRGGLAGTTVFDETLHPWLLDALARREQADGIVDVHAGAALIDPALLDAMIAHFAEVQSQVRLVFTQSAPGLSAAIYAPALLADLIESRAPLGLTMAYRPAEPQRDMIMLPCFFPPDSTIRRAAGRCLADTQAGWDRLQALLKAHDAEPDAAPLSAWLLQNQWEVPSLPAEVEIELTTDDPLPDSTLRPRGSHVPQRGPMDLHLFDRLITELAGRDDLRVVLGGFGDPLRHPQFAAYVQLCRQAGIFGLAVRTPAVDLDAERAAVLLDQRVDVLNVLLDAATPETYRAVHGMDHYDRVLGRLDLIFAGQREHRQPQPFVVCEMTKCDATLDEIEPFYDRWMSRTGSALIAGAGHYARQWPDRAVMCMAPPTRGPCARIFQKVLVLADGRVTICDQDYRGLHTLGTLRDQPLAALWQSPAMQTVRAAHRAGRYDPMPLCPACDEWHRP